MLGCAAKPAVTLCMTVGKGQGTRTIMVGSGQVAPRTGGADIRIVVKPTVVDGISVFFDGDKSLGSLVNLR